MKQIYTPQRPLANDPLANLPIEREFIIDAPIYGEVIVGSKRVKNRLLRNFFALLAGILAHQNVTMIGTGGGSFTANITGDISAGGGSKIATCSDTDTLAFNAYNCTQVESQNKLVVSSYVDGAKSVIEVVANFTKPASSVLLIDALLDTLGNGHSAAYGHSVISVPELATIRYRIVFELPLLLNFARAINGDLCDCGDPVATDMNGNQFNVNGQGTIFTGGAKILLGQGTTSPSPTDYTLTNPIELTTYVRYILNDQFAEIIVKGVYVPNASTTVPEIGLAITVRDTGCVDHDILIARHVFSTAPSLTAGRAYVFGFRIYGS